MIPSTPNSGDARLDQQPGDTQCLRIESGQIGIDSQPTNAGLDQNMPDTQARIVEPGQVRCDAQNGFAGLDQRIPDTQAAGVEPGHPLVDTQNVRAGLADARLLILADTLDDLERARIAAENRLRSMRQVKGLDGSPEYGRLAGLIDALSDLEHHAELELKRALRAHPLGAWVRATVGVGEKQGARLLAAIGDPAWNTLEDRPRRGPAELWAYCGYVPGQRRRKGERANWNSTAKMRAYLVAESCIKKSTSPYRPVYDAARAKHAEAVHDEPCPRCGPVGKPAPSGSPLSAGHQHARALREVAKAVLKDLWRAANQNATSQSVPAARRDNTNGRNDT